VLIVTGGAKQQDDIARLLPAGQAKGAFSRLFSGGRAVGNLTVTYANAHTSSPEVRLFVLPGNVAFCRQTIPPLEHFHFEQINICNVNLLYDVQAASA
jgi:hypothetical protein